MPDHKPELPHTDDWTRFSPPPKARISDRFASRMLAGRRAVAALAALVLACLLWAMLNYAAHRTDEVRREEARRQVAEPTRSELRERETREFLRQRHIEAEPFKRAQDAKARRAEENKRP